MRHLLLAALLILVPMLASAASGDKCPSFTPPAGSPTAGKPTCRILLDDISVTADSAVIWAPIQNASMFVAQVVRADKDGTGAVCDFDGFLLYRLSTPTVTNATYTVGAAVSLDDDATSGVVGVQAGNPYVSLGPFGPYVWIKGGTFTGACAHFSVWGLWYPPVGQ